MPIGDKALLLVCFLQPFPLFLSQTTQLPPHFEHLDPIGFKFSKGVMNINQKEKQYPITWCSNTSSSAKYNYLTKTMLK